MSQVLIADDEADIRILLRSLFEQRGWAVDEAANGSDAAERATNHTYDAIVLDHSMPGMTGAEVLRLVRGRDYRGPVIFYSAYLTPELERELEEDAGELHVVSKTDFGRLVSVIGELTGAA